MRQFSDAEALWAVGDASEFMYLVLEGKVNIERDVKGKRVGLHTVYAGEIAGEESLLAPGYVHESDAVFLEPGQTLAIDAARLASLRRWHPRMSAQFAYNFVCLLSDRLQQSNLKLYSK